MMVHHLDSSERSKPVQLAAYVENSPNHILRLRVVTVAVPDARRTIPSATARRIVPSRDLSDDNISNSAESKYCVSIFLC